MYKKQLKHTAEGTKMNPVSLIGLELADSETLGKKIIELYKNWKPEKGQPEEK